MTIKEEMGTRDNKIVVPDLTTSINQTVAIMILSSFLAISCLISPVFLDNEVVRKKLVRRRKQNWQSEEEGSQLSPRHISPVKKVFKRKIINSDGNGAQSQKQLVRRKVMPHILPDNQNVEQHFSSPNRIFPTLNNQSISPYINEAVPNKPMDAKRCKSYLLKDVVFSFSKRICQFHFSRGRKRFDYMFNGIQSANSSWEVIPL